jgi:hypothetical protein
MQSPLTWGRGATDQASHASIKLYLLLIQKYLAAVRSGDRHKSEQKRLIRPTGVTSRFQQSRNKIPLFSCRYTAITLDSRPATRKIFSWTDPFIFK